MLEYRNLRTAGDKMDLPFIHLAAETGNCDRTRKKTLEKILSFDHTFWDVMREGMYSKSIKSWYDADVYFKDLNKNYIGDRIRRPRRLVCSSRSEGYRGLKLGINQDFTIFRSSINNQWTAGTVNCTPLLRHIQLTPCINDCMFYIMTEFTLFPYHVEVEDFASI